MNLCSQGPPPSSALENNTFQDNASRRQIAWKLCLLFMNNYHDFTVTL